MYMKKGFICQNCGYLIPITRVMGTRHRNQCPQCLWSKHVDLKSPGDRKSTCLGLMEPIGLTFKEEGMDKYGKPRQGEIMIIHLCHGCQKLSINRIAADDDSKAILAIFEKSLALPDELKERIKNEGTKLLKEKDREEIRTQLLGRK